MVHDKGCGRHTERNGHQRLNIGGARWGVEGGEGGLECSVRIQNKAWPWERWGWLVGCTLNSAVTLAHTNNVCRTRYWSSRCCCSCMLSPPNIHLPKWFT